jgi:cell division protein FtsZ
MRVSVVATGIDAIAETQPRPVLKVYSAPQKLIRTKETEEAAEGAPDMPVTASAMATDANAVSVAETLIPQPVAPPALPAPMSAEPQAPAATAPAAPVAASAPVETPIPTPAEIVVESAPEVSTEVSMMTHATAPAAAPAATVPAEAAPVAPAAPVTASALTMEAPARPEPRLVAKNDAFMPPPPVNPKATTEAATASDAFKEADLVNGGSADDSRRKGPNLFQRITGAARDAKPEMLAARANPPAARTAPEQPAIASTPDKREETARQPAPQQASLSGVDPDDRLKTPQSDDDLLEIPAFLRRQAN